MSKKLKIQMIFPIYPMNKMYYSKYQKILSFERRLKMKKEYIFPEITIDILTAEDILTSSIEDELPDDIPDELFL